MSEPKRQPVYLRPTGTAEIPGVPAVPYRCTEEEADVLLRYQPPAFAVSATPLEGAGRPPRALIDQLKE